MDIWCGGYTYFHLYPNAPKTCDLELSKAPRMAPAGYVHYGEIWLRDGRGRGVVLKIPLKIRIQQD